MISPSFSSCWIKHPDMGYKKIGFILDRGYFSCENIQYMDKCGYSFVIMVKGMSALVNELILENKGTFENKRVNNIYEYGVYGKTIRHKTVCK